MRYTRNQIVFSILLLLLFIYFFVLQIWAVWPFTIDDMYIPLRYAKFWAKGHGIVWNIGEPPVEGYSNFSFLLLARMAISLGFDPIILLKAMGAVGLLLTTVAVYLLSRFWVYPRYAFLSCIWLLTYLGEISWSVSGLETAFYEALLCFSVIFIFRGFGYTWFNSANIPSEVQMKQPWMFFLAGFIMSIAGMTRPEATCFMLLFAFLILIHEKHLCIRGLLMFCSPLMVFFGPYFLWRWHHFGRLFPNSVYCKGFSDFYDLTLDINYLKFIWPFFILSVPAIYKARDRRHYFLWLPSVVYLGLLYGADTVVASFNRLFLSAYALILPLALSGMILILMRLIKRRDQVMDVSVYLAAFLFAFFMIPSMTLVKYRNFTKYTVEGEKLRQQVGVWLEQHVPSSEYVVLGDAGLVPYRTNLKYIDSYCLNNATMTKYPVPEMFQHFCETILQQKPHTIVLLSVIGFAGDYTFRIYPPTDICLESKLSESTDYRFVAQFSTQIDKGNYRYEIFTRR